MNTMTATRARQTSAQLALRDEGEGRAEFVSAMAAVPTAVTVVAFNDGNQIWGQTVSAFSSVSADPPTLLVCINTRSPLHERLQAGVQFSVNVLAPSQTFVADCFAGRSTEELPAYCAERLEWDFSSAKVPSLRGAASAFICRVDSNVRQATHGIVIATVLKSAHESKEPKGLAYCERQYRELH